MADEVNAEGDTARNGPGGSGKSGLDVSPEAIRFVLEALVQGNGERSPDAAMMEAIRDDSDRAEMLEALLATTAPRAISLSALARWLKGGNSPFTEPREDPVKKPTKVDYKRPSVVLAQTSARAERQRELVAEMKENVRLEEARLVAFEAHDRAAAYYMVANHLATILRPFWELGPMFTVARAISSRMTKRLEDWIVENTDKEFLGEERERMQQQLLRETEKLQEALDFFSGHETFEAALRKAMLRVVDDFASEREEAATAGHWRRSKSSRATSVNPTGRAGAEEVIEGLTRAAE